VIGFVSDQDTLGDRTLHPIEDLFYEPEIPLERMDDHRLCDRFGHGETSGETHTGDRVAVEVAAEGLGEDKRPDLGTTRSPGSPGVTG
jgi:hypothetical protein